MVICELLVTMINVIFVGRLGSAAMLAGIGMANVATGFTTNPLVVGFNSCLASYIPQSYGAGNLR